MAARDPSGHARVRVSRQTSESPATGAPSRRPRKQLPDEQLLARARELVAQSWCRRAPAEDRFGRPVEPWSASACRWSALGALTKVCYESRGEGVEAAYEALSLATGGRPEAWNAARWRTKWHVLSAFARARDYLPEARRRVRAGGRTFP